MRRQRPVLSDGISIPTRNHEEHAAATKAQTLLMRIVAEHKELNSAEEDHDDQFQYGQDFYAEPDVWEIDDAYFHDDAIYGPLDPDM